ncbi:MAG: hypothetical protein HYX47_01960 [Burkholderiales bacterium]|nr:hypothetical protein [Burkholderiales bacterium]
MSTEDEDIEGSLAEILAFCRQRKLQRNKEAFDRIADIISAQGDERLEGDARKRSLDQKYDAAISMLLMVIDPPGRDVFDSALEKIRKATGSDVTQVRILDDSPMGYLLGEALGAPRALGEGHDTVGHFRQRLAKRKWSAGRQPPQEGSRG